MTVLNERTKFPPHDMTEDEKAATCGRFVMSPTAVPDPAGSGDDGREQPAPHGTVYVRAESFDESVNDEPEVEPEEDEPEVVDEEVEEEVEEDDLDDLTVAEIKARLDDLDVEYEPKALKADLVIILRKAEAE